MRRPLALMVLLVGCNNTDFRPASLVVRPRIVGMVSSVASDPTRASPLGLEDVVVTPVVVAPEGEEGTLSTAWLACLAVPSRSGAPSCATPLSFSSSPMPGVVAPIELTLPEVAPTPVGAPSVLLTLASCDGGAVPDLTGLGMGSTMLPTCTGGAEDARAELTIFSMPIALSLGTSNHHPSISDEVIAIVEADVESPWDAAGAFPAGGCASLPPSAALPRFVATEMAPPPLTLTTTSSPDDRETYTTTIAGTGETTTSREALQISHFVTAGSFERQFSSVDADAGDDASIEIDWTLPARDAVPAAGLVVRFWWVVRDLRGGMDVTERALCVVPG